MLTLVVNQSMKAWKYEKKICSAKFLLMVKYPLAPSYVFICVFMWEWGWFSLYIALYIMCLIYLLRVDVCFIDSILHEWYDIKLLKACVVLTSFEKSIGFSKTFGVQF